MPTKTLISFLGKENTPDFEGRVIYKSPRLWNGKVDGDYVLTDRQNILEAFENKGVEDYAKIHTERSVERESGVNPTAASGKPEPDSSDEAGQHEASGTDAEPAVSKPDSLIPDDFESLNFFKQRAIAQKLTDEEVRTKEDVQRVISRSV